MWHASVAPRRAYFGATLCGRRAEKAVDGLGDPRLGEWREWSGAAFHLRRRLTQTEQAQIGPAVDIRRTPEAAHRAAALPRRLRDLMPPDVVDLEIGAR